MSRRVHVAHVITRLIVGGAQEAAVLACAEASRDQFESTLVIGPQAGTEGTLRPLADARGVRTVVVDPLVREIAPVKDRRAISELRRAFRELRPDIVQTHSSKAGLLGRWAARREHVPAVIHTVHGWSFHDHMPAWLRWTYVRLERRAARWCDRIITVSDLDREKGLTAGIGTRDQYVTIHEINDLERFARHRGDRPGARRRLGLPDDVPVVGTVGRFTEQKDPDTWIRAAGVVARRHPDARFVMIGDGPRRADIERVAHELGFGDRLLAPGLRDDVPELLPAFDVFLLTSRWEGLPLVIPQAMAAGVAVVASTADGNREVVQDGANGRLVSPHDPDRFATTVLELLGDPALGERLVAAGTETARAFALDATVPRLEGLYRELTPATPGSDGVEAHHEDPRP